ncbi:MAG: RidA family protein [Rhizobiaceae bacterium]|nr:RidA family protein [Rhizobiaceae bacterium]
MIEHHLKSADAQGKSAVRSSSIAVINGFAYMTVIPPLPITHDSTAADQARAIFAEIERRLERVGSNKARIAHITIWISHLLHFQEVTEVWNEWVDPDHPPVRACAQVNMANKNLKVEMIVVADAS